jgi:predicted exporter
VLATLIAFVALCAGWLLSLDPRAHFTTDVTELLPADERDPEARLALSLVRERQARVVLIALDAPADTPPARLAAAAGAHATALRASPAFAAALPLADQSWQHGLGALLHARRFDLLLPDWLAAQRAAYAAALQPPPSSNHQSLIIDDKSPPRPFPEWLATRVVAALDAHLASPAANATADLLPSDPLLLLPALADRAATLSPAPVPSPSTSSSLLTSRASALIWAETRAGPLSEEGQQPVFDALTAAEAAARVEVPGLSARFTGVARFAAAAKASTRDDISRLNLIAIAAVLLVAALLVRRPPALLHLLPVVLLSTLGAVAVTTLVFPRVHVLVFVLGSLLSGVAVDYAFHLVLARRENESYAARVRRLALPLLGGAGTTVAGFLILCLSELPLVRQLGVYVAAGIVVGLAATLLYFALFPRLDLAPRAFAPRLRLPVRLRAPVLIAFTLVAGLGLTRVRWQDDLRTLEYPAPQLRSEDAALRAAFGQTDTGATFLTRGATFAEARTRWQKFADAVPPDAALAGVATVLPAPEAYATAQTPAVRADLAAFAAAFRAASTAADYEPDAFAPFQRDLAAHLAAPPADYETLLGDTLAVLPGPLGLLAHAPSPGENDDVWFISSAPHPFPVPATAEGTLALSGLETLNSLFTRYRVAAGHLSVGGVMVLVLISCALHGPRLGLRTAALPLLATGLAFGLIAFRGEPFGLFHLLGALLGVCLADDYAHFAHADDGTPDARASIRLSALTTAVSFATLSLSAIPAIASLGAAVALIVLFALAFVETDLFSLRRHA